MTALRRAAALLAVAFVLAGAAPATAAPGARSELPVEAPVMLVVDTSGSMADPDGNGTVKVEGAKTAILELLGALPQTSRIGMRTYPAGGDDCGTGRLDFDVAQRNPGAMSAVVRALEANGGTPTAEALQAAADDVRDAGFEAATIVLVSDGESTCQPPCPVAQQLVDDGFDLTVNTVGFQIDSAGAEELQCIADSTGGTYTDVQDSASLGEQLAATQAPRLTLDVDAPEAWSPSESAAVTVTATVRNDSAVLARDVRASLVFSTSAPTGSPTVLRPLRVLGNVDPGGSTKVSWTVYPSVGEGGGAAGQFDWTVRLSGAQTTPQQLAGRVSVRAFSLADAAPWLQQTRHAVVLGDSYSSGEGAEDYVEDGTGGCHRSPHAYAFQLLPDAQVTNLACSGAVVSNYRGRQAHRTVEPQRDQLAGVSGYDLVLLTMGGNDIGFSDIIADCATGDDCNGRFTDHETAGADLRAKLAGLSTFYEDVLADTGTVPVVVLPYVGVVPEGNVDTGCGGTHALGGYVEFSAGELRHVQWLLGVINGAIEAEIGQVGDSRLVFASDVVQAVRPAHTLCSEDRWIVGLGDRGVDALAGPKVRLQEDQQQELVHPNAAGHRAIAAAVARWSHSVSDPREGARDRDRVSFLDEWFADLDGLLAQGTSVTVQEGADPSTVDPGAELRVRASGYAPTTLVLVVVHSTPQTLAHVYTDGDGDLDVVVTVPRNLAPGPDHELTVEGVSASGSPLVRTIGLTVGSPSLLPGLLLAGAGLLVAGGGWLLLRTALRRRRAD